MRPGSAGATPTALGSTGPRFADALYASFVSERTGLVRAVRELELPFARNTVSGYAANICGGDRALDLAELRAGGLSTNPDLALVVAIAEAIERYAWSRRCVDDQLVEAHPDFVLTRGGWTEVTSLVAAARNPCLSAVDLTSGRQVHLPVASTLGPYADHGKDDIVLPDLTTTGIAAGGTAEQAIASALAEGIERDAFVIAFANRLCLPQIDLATIDSDLVGSVLRELRGDRTVELRAWDMSLDHGFPIVLAALVVTIDGRPALRLGASAKPQGSAAVEKAVLEVIQCSGALTLDSVRQSRTSATSYSSLPLRDFPDHTRLGDRADYLERIDWMLAPRPQVAGPDLFSAMEESTHQGVMERLVASLSARGLRPLAVDITPSDVRETGLLQVWRTIVPGLELLRIGPPDPSDYGVRARTIPVQLGYRESPATDDDLNAIPHCFP